MPETQEPTKWKDVEPTKVEALAALGAGRAEIAAYLGLTVPCVRRRFSREFRRGRARGRVHLRQLLRQEAEEGKTPVLVWLAREMLGGAGRAASQGAGGAGGTGGPGGADPAQQQQRDAQLSSGLRSCLGDPEARAALLLVAEHITGLADPPSAPSPLGRRWGEGGVEEPESDSPHPNPLPGGEGTEAP
jgi:hypothetical protein